MLKEAQAAPLETQLMETWNAAPLQNLQEEEEAAPLETQLMNL
jgi:hypothetical protein